MFLLEETTKGDIMRVGFSTFSHVNCQPLRFGKADDNLPQKVPTSTPAEYEKKIKSLEAKYDLACRIACAQAEQYNKLVASKGLSASR